MSKKIVTIKDVATEMGVSVTTVHKAIYNKKGINGATRREILDYIDKNNFKLNKVASALKRRPIRLASVVIEPVGINHYFYASVQKGIDDANSDLEPFNVELTRYFTDFNAASQKRVLKQVLDERGDEIDGLLFVPAHERSLAEDVARFTERGTKVVTVNSDALGSTRSACVTSNAKMAGQIAAELLTRCNGEREGQVILLGGNHEMYNHRRIANGFFSYMREEAPSLDILELYDFEDLKSTERKLRKYLSSFDDIAGLFSNTSRNTYVMCQVIADMGLSGRFPVIGSDVFAELMPFFADRTLMASTYQNQYMQGYRGLQSLYYLITGEESVPDLTEMHIGIAIQSNAASFLT